MFTDKLETALSTLAGSIAGVSSKFESLAEPVGKFVEALQPGQAVLFSNAMRDLNATIGVAFLPVMQQLTQGVREAAALVLPAARALGPIFDQLSGTLKDLIVNGVGRASEGMIQMVPLLQNLAEVASLVGQSFSAGFAAITSFFKALLGNKVSDGYKSFFDGVKDVLKGFVNWLLIGTISLAKFVGATGFVDNFVKALEEMGKRDQGGVTGGLQDVSIKGLDQFTKDLAVAAQYAAGGGSQKSDKEYFKELADLAKLERDSNVSLRKWLTGNYPSAEALVKAKLRGAVNSIIIAFVACINAVVSVIPGLSLLPPINIPPGGGD